MKLEDLQLFHLVVETQSFTLAADQAMIPVANVSRRIKALEKDLGAILIQRTTRQLRITTAGKAFYQKTRLLSNELDNAVQDLQGSQTQIQGLIRIQVLPDNNLLIPLLVEYQNQNPKVKFEIISSSRDLDLIEHGIDIAVRIGKQTDSTLICRRIGTIYRNVVASPTYLEKYGRPKSPQDLVNHNCLVFRMPNGNLDNQWQVNGQMVNVKGNFILSQTSQLIELVASGYGIGYIPMLEILNTTDHKRMVPLFSQQDNRQEDIWFVYLKSQLQSRLLTNFVDFLIEKTRDTVLK